MRLKLDYWKRHHFHVLLLNKCVMSTATSAVHQANSVVYYLAGYVVHKMSKRKECQLCLHDISSAAAAIGSDAPQHQDGTLHESCK